MTTDSTFTIKPCYVILDASAAKGGVSYDREIISEREINGGDGSEKEYKATKRVDHKELCKAADALVSRARYMLRRYTTSTTIGWVCDAAMLPTLRAEIETVRAEAERFNQRSRDARCARRVTISIVPVKLELDNEAAATEIARTIRETLEDLKEKIAEGDAKKLRTLMVTRAANLDKLAAGMQRFAVEGALAAAEAARKELMAAAKEGREPECDVEAIDSAVGMFTDFGGVDAMFEGEGDGAPAALAM